MTANEAKQAAIIEAKYQNVDVDIVLATIEAENEFLNRDGDNGNALGYGQVWYSWHKDCFEYAARRLVITLPTTYSGITQLTLGNDEFSLIMTVNCIKQFWTSAGKNWDKFTKSYVGPAIPTADYNRRYKIWIKYHDGSGDYSSPSTNYTPTATATADNNTAPAETPVYVTNYGIVPNSLTKKEILYGRRYRMLVSTGDTTALDVTNLRITFNCTKTMLPEPNSGEVTIYNLEANTENSIIKEGMRIILEAGYEGDQYGLIFDGDILQPIREKEDGVTYKLTLSYLDSDKFANFSFSNFSILRGQSLRSIAETITNKASVVSEINTISKDYDNVTLARGKAVFGLSSDYLTQLAKSQSGMYYMLDGKANFVKLSDLPEGEIIELSPSSGLIETPSQTEQGITVKALLNPRLKLNTLIHIDNSLVRARKVEQGQLIRILDTDGIYRIIKITYLGDTRGEDWYCNMECISQAGILPSMLQGDTATNTTNTTTNANLTTNSNGENFIWPSLDSKTITSPFGMRFHPIQKINKMHTGIDIGAAHGTSVVASNSGTIIQANYTTGYGNTIVIDHGGGISTLYGHMSSLLVSVGQKVIFGHVIGKVGSTGNSTGPHLHFEVRVNGDAVDPLKYVTP